MQHFNTIELLDEKAALVTRFLNKAMEVRSTGRPTAPCFVIWLTGGCLGWHEPARHRGQALARDPLWEASNQDDRIEANALLEKYFMCRIYTSYVLDTGKRRHDVGSR